MLGYSQWRAGKDRVTRNYTFERWGWEGQKADEARAALPKPTSRPRCDECRNRTKSPEALNMLCSCDLIGWQLPDSTEVALS